MDPRDAHAAPHPVLPPNGSELSARVLSGLAVSALAFTLLWAGPGPFAALVVMIALAVCWEWTRMVCGNGDEVTFALYVLACTSAIASVTLGYSGLSLPILTIGALLVLVREFTRRPLFAAAGVLYAGVPAVSVVWLRGSDHMGFQAVLFVLMVVAATDTAAFISGRLIGGPKLAPVISPKKTWSGLIGGILAAAIAAAGFGLAVAAPIQHVTTLGIVLGFISQLGDLVESAIKRYFGVKDAGNLIPGHGGVMDRVDGMITAATMAAAIALCLSAVEPARALLATP